MVDVSLSGPVGPGLDGYADIPDLRGFSVNLGFFEGSGLLAVESVEALFDEIFLVLDG